MPTHDAVLNIGRLAELAGSNVPTVRYYEEIGLLPPARRKASGHRTYDESAVALLTFIRHCREFGFSLEDVRNLIALSSSTDRDCGETREVAARHLATVRQKLAELSALEQSLAKFVGACSTSCDGGPAPKCTILKDILATAPPPEGCCR